MAMAMTEAHERRWINTTWELQRQQNSENPEGMRDGEAGAGADYGSALLSSRVDWELKDWESITLAYPTSDENCCSSSSLPETVMVSAAVVKSEPQAEVEESEEEEEEEEKVVHQAPEAAAAAAAPLKLGLKLGRRSSSSSTEKNKKEKSVSQGSCSKTTSTSVIAPPPAAVAVAVAAGSSSSSPPSTKKQRVTSPSSAAAAAAGGGNQNPAPPPRCQVEGCTADLSSAKDYHRRHKVCEMHSKASKAIAAGREQRFCQQCSRFHVLTEFDEIKRSCRRRLAGHNERRRKPHLESSSSAAAAAAAAAAINLSFNCRISSPMHSTDAFHIHGTAADSLTLDDCKQTQFLEQIQGSQGGGRSLSSPDLHDDDEHSNHHHPFANVLNLSSPWRPGENVQSPQHIQQVEEKEGQLIMLDRRYCAPSSNRLLMFLQSPRGQMRGALDPSPDVGLSNLSPLVVGGGGSSQEFVDGAKGSLCQNLSLGGGGGWENNNHHNYHHNQGCESQNSGCALSLLSWGTTPCPPALDLCVDNTSLDHHHHHQLVADNNMGSNTVASFATHHLPQQQSQEHYLAFEKLFSAQSGGLEAMGISDIRIADIQQQQQPLEQSQLHGVGGGGGGGDDGASGNFLSYLGGLGLDAGNSMLALFQSSHDLQGMRSGVSSAHQSLKVTSDLVCTPSLQVHQQHHLHQVHTTTTSLHSQMQTSFNGGGEYGEFGPPLRACESSLFSTQHML